MSCSTSVAVAYGGGDVYSAPPFTALQWQELEHQALIYKYLMAGVPVPSDLVLPIRRSLQALSATFLHHPTLGYCSYYGKKFDPEPGRCKRTDGKKWRCSKDVHHDSKYCERHMHRGRNRSRKPVESQALSTAMSAVNSSNSGNGSCLNVSSGRSSSQSLYSVVDSGGFDFGSSVSKLQVDAGAYVIKNKDIRYSQGLTVNVDSQNYPSKGNARDLSMGSNVDGSWGLMPSHIPTNSLLKPQDDSYLQTNSLQLNMANTFEPVLDATSVSTQRQQHCFIGSEIGSQEQAKHGQHLTHPFFSEWPKAKEPWSNCDATTQLSISMDSDFNASNACSPNDA